MSPALATLLAPLEFSGEALVVRVPAGFTKRHQLLECLKAGLKCPDDVGSNWDALDEVLNDLAWLSATTIIIAHEDFPQLPDQDFGIYLDILESAVEEWRGHGGKSLSVLFG